MTKDETVKLALEALEWMVANDDTNEGDEPVERFGGQSWNEYNAYWLDGLNNSRAAITAIKQALAAQHEPENEPFVSLASVQEPVAWMQDDGCHFSIWKDKYSTIPLYTTPPAARRQWVGLTDEEIEACDCLHVLWMGDDDQELVGKKEFARAIEAKLKEKNT
jgi:hypothetical protein